MTSKLSRALIAAVLGIATGACSGVPGATPAVTQRVAPPTPRISVPTATQQATHEPATAAATASSRVTASPVASAVTTKSWATDLAFIDANVRSRHPGPFTNHSEAEWESRLAELEASLPATDSRDEQFVQLASLIALLDTHSWIEPAQQSRAYPVLVYGFPEGWFVVAAGDRSLIGSRLVSINGKNVAELETIFSSLVPHDNDSGLLDGMQGWFSYVEDLHGSRVVDDIEAPDYVFEMPDGTEVRPEMKAMNTETWTEELELVGGLVGDAPEAVARRTERIWTRVDTKHHAVLVSVNDYGDMTSAIAALTAALDSGEADRVIVDMRYLRGGNGDIKLIEALAADSRINRPGGLTVLIGRENVSAATDVAHYLDANTSAVLVGEETPARADGFRCYCLELRLPFSGHLVVIPTHVDHNGDTRSSIPPDFPMQLTAADFFAGRDPVLDAALDGSFARP